MANVFQQTHCPICGEKVTENDEWTITVDKEMNPQILFHKKCYEDKMKFVVKTELLSRKGKYHEKIYCI